MTEQEEVRLGWNGKGLTARGRDVVLVILAVAIIGAQLWTGWRIEQSNVRIHDTNLQGFRELRDGLKEQTHLLSREHGEIKQMERDQACLMSFSFEERRELRRRWPPGGFRELCPWLRD